MVFYSSFRISKINRVIIDLYRLAIQSFKMCPNKCKISTYKNDTLSRYTLRPTTNHTGQSVDVCFCGWYKFSMASRTKLDKILIFICRWHPIEWRRPHSPRQPRLRRFPIPQTNHLRPIQAREGGTTAGRVHGRHRGFHSRYKLV